MQTQLIFAVFSLSICTKFCHPDIARHKPTSSYLLALLRKTPHQLSFVANFHSRCPLAG
jgi:hypothetical protein